MQPSLLIHTPINRAKLACVSMTQACFACVMPLLKYMNPQKAGLHLLLKATYWANLEDSNFNYIAPIDNKHNPMAISSRVGLDYLNLVAKLCSFSHMVCCVLFFFSDSDRRNLDLEIPVWLYQDQDHCNTICQRFKNTWTMVLDEFDP